MSHTSDNKYLYTTSQEGLSVSEIASILGRNTLDVGQLCGDVNAQGVAVNLINMNAKFKPIIYPALHCVTEAQRTERFQGLIPKDLSQVRSHRLGGSYYIDSEANIASPVRWDYERPTGGISTAPYRMFDFLKITTGPSPVAGEYGYFHLAKAAMNMGGLTTKAITVVSEEDAYNSGTFIDPNYKLDNQSVNQSGSPVDININLDELYPKNYGVYKDIDSWKFPQDAYTLPSGQTSLWRFGIAIPVKVMNNDTLKYQWALFPTVDPLSKPLNVQGDVTATNNHRINPSKSPNSIAAVIRAARFYDQTSFKCVPFLAYGLAKDNSGNWMWGGSTYDKCMTFPEADTFFATFSGFATTMTARFASVKIGYGTASTQPTTWYSGTINSYQGVNYISFQNLPSPSAGQTAAYYQIEFYFYTGYGTLSAFKGMLTSSSDPDPTLYQVNSTPPPTAVDNVPCGGYLGYTGDSGAGHYMILGRSTGLYNTIISLPQMGGTLPPTDIAMMSWANNQAPSRQDAHATIYMTLQS